MVDSSTVLWGQAIAYTIYVIGAMTVVGWFAYRVTRAKEGPGVKPVLFWGFSFVATKVALQSFTPFCLIFFRFIAASVFFILLLSRCGFPRLSRQNLGHLALLAVFQPGLYFTFETIGLQ